MSEFPPTHTNTSMENAKWCLPESLHRDFRQWLHDVRGAVGIVSSTLELLAQEDLHPVATKYIQIIQRQMQRVLMESELFGAQLHFRPEMFEGSDSFVLELFTEVQDIVGTNIDVQYKSELIPRVKLPPYLLKIVFLSILIPPSSLDPRAGMHCLREGDTWRLEFVWSGAVSPLAPKFLWADRLLRRFGAQLQVVPGFLYIICPAW